MTERTCCGMPLDDNGRCQHRPWHKQAESGSADMDIPQAAIEAVTKRLVRYTAFGLQWDELDEGLQGYFTSVARDALKAAFPHLRPLFQQATAIGRELGRREVWEQVADAVSLGEDWQVEDPRISYVDVQIDKDAYLFLQEVLAARSVPSAASGASSDAVTGAGTATGDTEEVR